MTMTEKKQTIRAELAYQASDICTDIIAEHDGRTSYEQARDRYHELAAQNIDAWSELTFDINEAEEELDDATYSVDAETGTPDAAYDAVYQKLEDMRATAEEWAGLFEEMFEEFWERMSETIYGEWD